LCLAFPRWPSDCAYSQSGTARAASLSIAWPFAHR
jgi:hypothetical protein